MQTTVFEKLFTLENFEGPIDFLLHLVQQNEIPILEVDLHRLTSQFLELYSQDSTPEIDLGAEFISSAAFLLWLKSRTLLPQHEQTDCSEEQEEDPRFSIIHQLLDYCRFKEAAKALGAREISENAFYYRGLEGAEAKKILGIEHLSLQDLASLFKEVLAKVEIKKGSIAEEEWKVSDKIEAILEQLEHKSQIRFEQLFNPSLSRLELIVTFLALLELMKRGNLRVLKDEENVLIKRADTR